MPESLLYTIVLIIHTSIEHANKALEINFPMLLSGTNARFRSCLFKLEAKAIQRGWGICVVVEFATLGQECNNVSKNMIPKLIVK